MFISLRETFKMNLFYPQKTPKKTLIQIFIRKILNVGGLYRLYMKAIYSDRTNAFNIFDNILCMYAVCPSMYCCHYCKYIVAGLM